MDNKSIIDNLNSLQYLQRASTLLSNPIDVSIGRDMVIRALDNRPQFIIYDELLKQLVRKAGLYPYLKS
ncbi:MAG: hypothetical protein RPT25_09295, partial [Cycloclasticus sp.]